jgi:hypothetical protein
MLAFITDSLNACTKCIDQLTAELVNYRTVRFSDKGHSRTARLDARTQAWDKRDSLRAHTEYHRATLVRYPVAPSIDHPTRSWCSILDHTSIHPDVYIVINKAVS